MTAPHPLAELAATARAAASAARDGSPERRAAGCVAVALSTCRTLAAARRALETVRPDAVRVGALAYLVEITELGDDDMSKPEMTNAEMITILEDHGLVAGEDWRIMKVDGRREIVVSAHGVRVLAATAPNQANAAAFAAELDRRGW